MVLTYRPVVFVTGPSRKARTRPDGAGGSRFSPSACRTEPWTKSICPYALETTGHRFRDAALLLKALTHASVADSRLVSNERLEFLGDAVLGMVVCDELYGRFPDWLEGDLTKVKSVVVSRRECARSPTKSV